MSRIGRKPVKIPQGVKVEIKDGFIKVEGAKGKSQEKINSNVEIAIKDGEILFTRKSEEIPARAAHGMMRSKVANMVTGVAEGFQRNLEINGVGYKAELKGTNLELSVGFSYPKAYQIPAGIKIEVEKATKVKITGNDKALVGKVASEIRKIRPPEPYKGKGIKFAEEIIKRKVGKAAVTAAS